MERIIADVRDAGGNGDAGEAGNFEKSIVSNAGDIIPIDRVRNNDRATRAGITRDGNANSAIIDGVSELRLNNSGQCKKQEQDDAEIS